jgi:hypothetical protein
MVPHSGRYDRVAGSYSQYRPRYPDELLAHLAGLIATVPATSGAGLVLDIGSGTGTFGRRAWRGDARPGAGRDAAGGRRRVHRRRCGGIPFDDKAAIAITAATAAHRFDRPAFYAEAPRIDTDHVAFGYLFQCITARRDP